MAYDMKILVVVDMQNDFVTGVLGSEEAKAIVPNIKKKIEEKAKTHDYIIFFTKDTHNKNYLNTEEGKHLPIPHCYINTPGWCIVPELYELSERNKIVEKQTFGYNKWDETIKETLNYRYSWSFTNITEIEIVGVCTDFCVLANAFALKAIYPNIPITIDAACCAGSTPEMHEKALDKIGRAHV